jgi:hypothetical protein
MVHVEDGVLYYDQKTFEKNDRVDVKGSSIFSGVILSLNSTEVITVKSFDLDACEER